jgi:hypothetical protein
MAEQDNEADLALVLQTLIRFEDQYDAIVRQLMDNLDEDRVPPERPPTLRAEDVASLCARVQRRDLSPAEVQKWARVVKGLSEIRVESQRLYAIVTELAIAAIALDRYAEIQLALAA